MIESTITARADTKAREKRDIPVHPCHNHGDGILSNPLDEELTKRPKKTKKNIKRTK